MLVVEGRSNGTLGAVVVLAEEAGCSSSAGADGRNGQRSSKGEDETLSLNLFS